MGVTRGLLVVVVNADSRCEAVVGARDSIRSSIVGFDGVDCDVLPNGVPEENGFYYARATTNVMDGVIDRFGNSCFVEVKDVDGRLREWVVYSLGFDSERDLFCEEFECSGEVYVYDCRDGVSLITDKDVFENELLGECGDGMYAVLLTTKY